MHELAQLASAHHFSTNLCRLSLLVAIDMLNDFFHRDPQIDIIYNISWSVYLLSFLDTGIPPTNDLLSIKFDTMSFLVRLFICGSSVAMNYYFCWMSEI